MHTINRIPPSISATFHLSPFPLVLVVSVLVGQPRDLHRDIRRESFLRAKPGEAKKREMTMRALARVKFQLLALFTARGVMRAS